MTETNRHAGHADILREQLGGPVGTEADSTALQRSAAAFWANHRDDVEQARRLIPAHAGSCPPTRV